jgi:hypothetical protein
MGLASSIPSISFLRSSKILPHQSPLETCKANLASAQEGKCLLKKYEAMRMVEDAISSNP